MPRLTRAVLTDSQVRHLPASGSLRDVSDGAQRGLLLTVLPSGRKQWTLRYRFGNTQRRLVLGEYPALTLSKAREEAGDARNLIRKGQDPAAERREAKASTSNTIGALAAEYLKLHARRFKKSADEDERILNVYVLPRWKARSVAELTRREVRALVEAVVNRGAPIMANRVLAVVRKMLNFGVDHDWLEANPAARVAKPSPEVSRDRVLNDEELRKAWGVLSRFPTTPEKPAPGRKASHGTPDDPICPFSPTIAALLKVRMLTAQRGGEVSRMRWKDLDLDAGWWTIPGIHTKNGEAHRVFLVPEAIALIKAQTVDKEREYVFIGAGASVLDRAKKAPAAMVRLLGFEFRGHDLRRTAATRMAGAGVRREHIARVLNHVEGGPRATRVYDRHNYDPEKREAMQTWARLLIDVVEPASVT